MPQAWGPCRRHGDHAAGMETMPQTWRPCRRHGDRRLGNHAAGMGTMLFLLKVTLGLAMLAFSGPSYTW